MSAFTIKDIQAILKALRYDDKTTRQKAIIDSNNKNKLTIIGENQVTTNMEKARAQGWLDENGVCVLPDDVKACVLGFKSPTLPAAFFAKATPEQLQQAIDQGWIKFFDGDGTPHTFAEYVATYPAYPDPIFQLEIRGTWPPKAENIFVIGGKK